MSRDSPLEWLPVASRQDYLVMPSPHMLLGRYKTYSKPCPYFMLEPIAVYLMPAIALEVFIIALDLGLLLDRLLDNLISNLINPLWSEIGLIV